jgi:hypothetical protein
MNPACDHYWLVRRGGTCPHCKDVFPGQMKPPRSESYVETVVHILHHGWPLCAFSKEQPGAWPQGHKWVRLEAKEDATCSGCLSAAQIA